MKIKNGKIGEMKMTKKKGAYFYMKAILMWADTCVFAEGSAKGGVTDIQPLHFCDV